MQILDLYNIQKRFLRSAHLERDFRDASSLDGYVVTDGIGENLARITSGLDKKSGQRSWRISGSYGSGKSSFALLLAQLYSRQEETLAPRLRRSIQKQISDIRRINIRFAPVLVTGAREPLANALLRGLDRTLTDSPVMPRRIRCRVRDQVSRLLSKPTHLNDRQVVEVLLSAHAELVAKGVAEGLLIILDELGKFLEFAALHPDRQDIFLLQQLAEAATRSHGETPLFLIGLLHQGFSAYAELLSQSAQREWEKVAGRFEELLFNQPLEQITGLITSALNIRKIPDGVENYARAAMRQAVELGWYGQGTTISALTQLAPSLYPIHPTVVPVLARFFARYGQNERSLFSFLLSTEPGGLMDFSRQPPASDRFYRLSNFYDYVAANFGHRLGTQSYRSHWNHIDSVIKGFAAKNEADPTVLKTVGILNLVNSTDSVPVEQALVLALAGQSGLQETDVRSVLHRLHKERHVLFLRGSSNGYCLWSHISVDLDSAYDTAARHLVSGQRVAARIKSYLDTSPLVARRHYIQTGNLRCFEVVYCDLKDLESSASGKLDVSDGRILLPLCETAEEVNLATKFAREFVGRPEVLIGVTDPLVVLDGLVQEVERWTWVQSNTPELKDDRYAAEEVDRQLKAAKNTVQKFIEHHVGLRLSSRRDEMPVRWYYEGKQQNIKTGPQFLAFISQLCTDLYKFAPKVQNELVNRRSISPSATLARSRLIDRILTSANMPLLGMDETKKPPEMAIYMSILQAGGVHTKQRGHWGLSIPDKKADVCHLGPALQRIGQILLDAGDERVGIPVIFEALRSRPFGVKDGLIPLLLALYLQINWHRTAFYEDGTYRHQVGSQEFIRLTKEPEHFELQHCAIEGIRAEVFSRLISTLKLPVEAAETPTLLDVVRPLVKFVAQLPDYSKKTKRLSASTVAVRTALLEAREPSKLLFSDLPKACGLQPFRSASSGGSDRKQVAVFADALQKAISEMQQTYEGLLTRMSAAVLEMFGVDVPLQKFREDIGVSCARLKTQISDSSLKAFVIRLGDGALQRRQWLESLGSLLAKKPPERWLDQDEVEFEHQLALCAQRLNRVEAVLFRAGADTGQQDVCRLVMTRPDGREVEHVFHWEKDESERMKEMERQLSDLVERNGKIGLAAAAKVVWRALQ